MNFNIVKGILNLNMDLVTTTALSGLILLLGYLLCRKIHLLEKYCIPAAVVGGTIIALITWGLRSTGTMIINLDTTLQTPFMIAFFACVGYGGSFKLLKAGGKHLLTFLVLCWIMAISQNIIGVGLAKLLGIQPVLGVMAGAVSLVGGPANAAAFGPMAEALGVKGATTVAVAAAIYGIILGCIAGGPYGNFLIKKFKPEIKSSMDENKGQFDKQNTKLAGEITPRTFINIFVLILVFMFFGGLFSNLVKLLNIKSFALPGYVGAMFVAILFRNMNDKFHFMEINQRIIDIIKEVGLGFFLTMTIMTLKIWELKGLAIPLIIILLVQTIIVFVYIYFLVWRFMGKDYDAAAMSAGFTGVGLGVTATAVASMSAVCEKYDEYSYKAFLIVPLCCAVFVDIVSIPCIIFFISYFA